MAPVWAGNLPCSWFGLQLLENSLRAPYVCCLRGLVSSGEHDDENATPTGEIQPIPWPEVHSHLGYPAASRLAVSQIAGLSLPQAGGNPNLSLLVAQAIEPGFELRREPDGEHARIVSDRIQMSSCSI